MPISRLIYVAIYNSHVFFQHAGYYYETSVIVTTFENVNTTCSIPACFLKTLKPSGNNT